MTIAADATLRSAKFGLIEAGRGVASALVVLHHSGNIMAQPRFYGAEPFWGHFRNFNVGVDFFFVLSGFIIAWIHWPDIGKKDRIAAYARKRLLRIYPPYWGVLLPLILLYLLVPSAGIPSQHDTLNIILSVLLLPSIAQPVLGVAWTLTHEIFFYALFALIIRVGQRGLIVLPFWALAIVAAHFLEPLPFPFSFVFNPFNLEFIAGVGAAAFLRQRRMPMPGLAAIVGVALFAVLMLFATHIQDDALAGRIAFGIPSLLFVLGAVEFERSTPIRVPPTLRFLGASSYAVYLIHPIALSFAIQIISRTIGRGLPLDIIALLLFVVGLSAGSAYHIHGERRLIVLASRVLSGRRKHGKFA